MGWWADVECVVRLGWTAVKEFGEQEKVAPSLCSALVSDYHTGLTTTELSDSLTAAPLSHSLQNQFQSKHSR